MNGYSLTKIWYEFTISTGLTKPNHHALYHYLVYLANKLDWPLSFQIPNEPTMHGSGIGNYRTFKNTLQDLVDWGFIRMVEKSFNQHTANRIALVEMTKAPYKAKPKQSTKQRQSSADINKPIKPNKPKNLINRKKSELKEEELSENEKSVSIDLPPDRIQIATKKIADFFKISEITMPAHYMTISRFVYDLNESDQLDYLSKQFAAYAELKSIEKGYKHSWKKYIGTQEKDYQDGVWNLEDWSEKLKEKLEFNKSLKKEEEQKVIKLDYSKYLKSQSNERLQN